MRTFQPYLAATWMLLFCLPNASAQSADDAQPDSAPSSAAASPPAQNTDGWQWNPVAGARCGNGSPTGYGWKPAPTDSRQLVIFFQGGGACRSFLECYVLRTASRVSDGYDAAHFAEETQKLADFLLTQSSGPFSAMNMAWVPYCTGDLHAGRNVYKEFNGRRTYHLGGANVDLDMADIAARIGQVDDVWLVGFSAGGFATLLNSAGAKATFPNATLHVIDDSGLAFADSSHVPDRWGSAPFPADCARCSHNFSLMLPYLARTNPEGRFAYVSYTRDKVLPLFFHRTEGQFRQSAEEFADILDVLALPNLSYFYVPARGHVVSENPDATADNIRLADWVTHLVDNAGGWTSERAAPQVDDNVEAINPANGTESVLDPEHGLPDEQEEEDAEAP